MFRKPAEIADAYPDIGARKTRTPALALLFRAALAGAFIALATVCAHSVNVLFSSSAAGKLTAALLFPAGLAMVLLCGAELFTGNCMLTIAWWSQKISAPAVLKNWGIVYVGNFLGALVIAWLSIAARPGDTAYLEVAVSAAGAKAMLPFGQAFLRGILCNILVCAAVWMSYSAENATGKMVAMYMPVALFILCGTEHCVANMYYFTAALFAEGGIAISSMLRNLAAVTLGNIVGGALLFSGAIWMSFPRRG